MAGGLQTRVLGRRPLLFLIADTGGGHRASAQAVAEQVAGRHGARFSVELLDPFLLVRPGLVGRIVGLYSVLVRRAPWLWGGIYHATDSRLAVAALQASVLRLVAPPLRRALDTLEPAAVVSFHPLLNHVTARVIGGSVRRGQPGSLVGAAPPLITVVTDLTDIHAAWICADAEALVVPSAPALQRCRRAGMAASRSYALGLPVGATFSETPIRSLLRRHLGLDPDGFVVLITGGAEGGGDLARAALTLARGAPQVEVVAICGRNTRLRRRLKAQAERRGLALRTEGFVDNMADWMRAADLVVSKAGPGTIAEAACSGTPLLLTSYVPGQERGNVDLVVDSGAGCYVPRLSALRDRVAALADPRSAALAAMRHAVSRHARPAAAADIADLVCRLAVQGEVAAA